MVNEKTSNEMEDEYGVGAILSLKEDISEVAFQKEKAVVEGNKNADNQNETVSTPNQNTAPKEVQEGFYPIQLNMNWYANNIKPELEKFGLSPDAAPEQFVEMLLKSRGNLLFDKQTIKFQEPAVNSKKPKNNTIIIILLIIVVLALLYFVFSKRKIKQQKIINIKPNPKPHSPTEDVVREAAKLVGTESVSNVVAESAKRFENIIKSNLD